MKTMKTISVAVVDETCRAACKAMKLQSKQLLMLSASYSKLSFEASGDDILEALNATMNSIERVQDSLTKAAKKMKMDTDESRLPCFPDTVVVTAKEYLFLNAVLQEYTKTFTQDSSGNYSLFSSSLDICSGARQTCLDSAEKSKDS